jgi:hypothetical protein
VAHLGDQQALGAQWNFCGRWRSGGSSMRPSACRGRVGAGLGQLPHLNGRTHGSCSPLQDQLGDPLQDQLGDPQHPSLNAQGAARCNPCTDGV